jgi:hypothetical protein
MDVRVGDSMRASFARIGRFDALVSCVGKGHFGEFAKLTEQEMMIGLKDKLMGQ